MNLATNNSINSIILSITDNCNLACKYCFVQHNIHEMPIDIGKYAIDFLSHNKTDINKEITFFGGEPLLKWDDFIVPVVKYAKAIGEKINFSITTNGILIDKDKLDFMKENNISILLSMDGDKPTQDYNRPYKNGRGTFELLSKQLPLILDYFPNLMVRGTIYPDTCKYLFQNVKYFMDHKVRNIYFIPDEFSIWTEEQQASLQEEIRKIMLYYLNAFIHEQFPINFSPFTTKFIQMYNENGNDIGYCADCKQCGLGQQVITLDYQGNIYSCQELSSYPLIDNLYHIGNITTGIDYDKYDKLQKAFTQHFVCEEPEYCDICEFKNACAMSVCHANSYIKFKNLNTKSKIKCLWDNTLYKECKLLLIILSVNNNSTFEDYYLELLKEEAGYYG